MLTRFTNICMRVCAGLVAGFFVVSMVRERDKREDESNKRIVRSKDFDSFRI